MKKIRLFVLFLSCVLTPLAWSGVALADTTFSVTLSPTNVDIQQGQTFTIKAYINTNSVDAQQVWVNIFFDHSKITYSSFSRGTSGFSDCSDIRILGDDEVTATCWNSDASNEPSANHFVGSLTFTGNIAAQTTVFSDSSSGGGDQNGSYTSTEVDVPVNISAPPSANPTPTPTPPSSSSSSSSKPSTSSTSNPTTPVAQSTTNQAQKTTSSSASATTQKPDKALDPAEGRQLKSVYIFIATVLVVLATVGFSFWRLKLPSKLFK